MQDLIFALGIIGVFAGGLFTGVFGMYPEKYNILQNKTFILAQGNLKGHLISIGISFLSAILVCGMFFSR